VFAHLCPKEIPRGVTQRDADREMDFVPGLGRSARKGLLENSIKETKWTGAEPPALTASSLSTVRFHGKYSGRSSELRFFFASAIVTFDGAQCCTAEPIWQPDQGKILRANTTMHKVAGVSSLL
jgi:hypothetical protein